MDILGIGGAELVLIVLVMLVVAGPKRMIQWAYIAGKYAGQARRLWQETAEKLQAELDGAGVDVKVPRKMQLPTGAALQAQMRSRIAQAAQPAREIEREFAAALKEDDTRPVPAVTERDAAPQP
jgi:Sec-independent protein translocase protein TatA